MRHVGAGGCLAESMGHVGRPGAYGRHSVALRVATARDSGGPYETCSGRNHRGSGARAWRSRDVGAGGRRSWAASAAGRLMTQRRISAEAAAEVVRLMVEESAALFRRSLRATNGDWEEAEDLVQETFQAAALNWAKLRRWPRSRQRAWLFRVLINKAIESLAGRTAGAGGRGSAGSSTGAERGRCRPVPHSTRPLSGSDQQDASCAASRGVSAVA